MNYVCVAIFFLDRVWCAMVIVIIIAKAMVRYAWMHALRAEYVRGLARAVRHGGVCRCCAPE